MRCRVTSCAESTGLNGATEVARDPSWDHTHARRAPPALSLGRPHPGWPDLSPWGRTAP